jgi:predicted alpha-1,2-mannosidase
MAQALGTRRRHILAAASVVVAAAAGASAAPSGFLSSFEPDDPQLAWTDTVQDDRSGPKAGGVDGTFLPARPGSVLSRVAEVTASGEARGFGEVKENLIDGDPGTKWLTQATAGWVQLRLSAPVALQRYVLSSANDAAERDPRDWTLQGSADGHDWTTLDTRVDQVFAQRLEAREFSLEGASPYAHYRLHVARNNGAPLLQLGDVELLASVVVPPPAAPTMQSHFDAGPSSAPAAKARVGFTGRRALVYAGHHRAQGRGYSYNKLFDVDIPVTPTMELSYLIFPALGRDLSYRSTYAAVDLAFADGTYLSALGAEDHHGVRLDPRSQGESKTLYVDQWNHKKAALGKVAAGKKITRILIAYDHPAGSGPFRGWIDDIRIAEAAPPPSGGSLADLVLTTRGTHSSGRFSRGNNLPATAVPNGFNFWTPVTNAGSTSWLYEYHRANNTENLPALQAFAVSHQPSPWMGDRQTFQVLPSLVSGVPDASRAGRALAFRHENERARPHVYAVTFENGIRAEIAPTDHAALLRFTFPGPEQSLLFDNVNGNGGLTLDAARRVVTAYSDVRSNLSAGATRLFVHAEFDRPVTHSGMLPGGGGPKVTGYFRFDPGAERVVTMRIGTSLLGVAQARRNLELEIAPEDTLETVVERARKLWDEKLGLIGVEGASEDQRVTLYSNLYRLFLYPNSAFENTGTAERPVYKYASPFSPRVSPDTETEAGARIASGKAYVNNGFWDTFRTTWPALALLTPRLAGELVDGFVQQYKDGGWIARWSSPGYANLMAGTSSDVAFADAYVKGVTNFDAPAAYQAALKNAAVAPPNASVGRKGLETSIFLGYTTTATDEGTSWALDGYVNDFGIANMAGALASDLRTPEKDRRRYQEEHEYYLDRARGYVNMFDPAIGFFQGRSADGRWRLAREEYDPRVWGHDYTETNGWNFAFTVPHDGQGLANLYGGRAKLAAKLDAFFGTPETAEPAYKGSYGGVIHEMVEARDTRLGQYGHSNQPSHHIIYMYDYAGQPWKAQALAREILARTYLGSEIGQGYPGDEDNGEMSAWYVFSALGLYPLQVGSARYAIGSPLFTKATVHLENGRQLVVRARGNGPRNTYVQSLKVNGRPYTKTYLPHSLVVAGAELDFEMGPRPSRWGTGPDDAPPSITRGPEVPRPLRDLTGRGRGAGTASGAVDPAGLFDDTSATRITFSSRTPWVQYQLSAGASEPAFYTLTSADTAGDPKDWTLQGSQDGRSWTVLDTREDETFDWRLYTRPFKIARPGKYAHYRLEVTENSGESTTALAELELLGRR